MVKVHSRLDNGGTENLSAILMSGCIICKYLVVQTMKFI